MPRTNRPFWRAKAWQARLASDVIERIAREEIAAGERLPTEAEIATQYGVSRTVVREAISRLRADGDGHRAAGSRHLRHADGIDASEVSGERAQGGRAFLAGVDHQRHVIGG